MHYPIFVAALLAMVAFGKPIKRDYVTEDVIITVTTTITEGANPPAPTAETSTFSHFHHWSFTNTVTTSTVASVSSSVAPVSSPVAPAPTSLTAAASSAAASSVAAAPTSTTSTDIEATTTSTASSSSSTGISQSDYETMVLDQHNNHRGNHSASVIVWNDTLASIAETIAQSCVYAHNTAVGGGGYGQNIGAGAPPQDVGAMLTNEMYDNEIPYYPLPYGNDNPDMSQFESWGHFSQIVWQSTVGVGCATVTCSSISGVGNDVAPYFTVCNYYPPGNVGGEYSNVGAPLGEATVTISD